MIQPVNALTPKVLFRGELTDRSVEEAKSKTKRNLALYNATGISVALGAATTALARSSTTSWKGASYFGFAAAIASMVFLIPGFLYKSGINIYAKPIQKDSTAKDIFATKKLFSEVGEISNAAKNTTKTSLRTFAKV